MLLDFKISNYKSFWEEADFLMTPAPRQTGLDYSVQSKKIGKTTYRALSSAVIYGPNASGKTNLIGAMDTMRALVLRGNIKDADPEITANPASALLEMIPNRDHAPAPTIFSIRFIEQDLLVAYTFTLQLGNFLDADYHRQVSEEKLEINGQLAFHRTDHLVVEAPSEIKAYLNPAITDNLDTAIGIAESGLNDEELFLCNGYKSIFSKNSPL